ERRPFHHTLAWHGEITAANAEEVWQQTSSHLATLISPTTAQPSTINHQPSSVTLDLSDVPFIDSTGLGLMVRAKKFAQGQGVPPATSFHLPRTLRQVLECGCAETVSKGFAPNTDWSAAERIGWDK